MTAVLTGLLPYAEYSRNSSKRKWQAFASALALEAIVIGAVIAWAVSPQPKLAVQVIALTIESITSPPPLEPQEPEKVRHQPPPINHPAKPTLHAPTPAAALPVPTPVQQATQASTPLAATPAPAAPSVAMPATASETVADPAPAYNAKIAAAVQAAFQIPAAASTLGFKGRARVEFSLREGSAHTIRIALTSGFGAVDRAAIQAVQSATYPAPPAALAGKEGVYQIWVACF